jgi:hypothetical protein
MARSSIRVGVKSRVRIRARALARFPAQVIAGDGITIAQSGGVFTFALDVDYLEENLGDTFAVRAGDNVYTGTNTFVRVDGEALAVRSGNSASYTYLGIGRAVTDLSIGAAAASDHFTLGTVAGDASINASASLHLAAGNATASIKIGPTAGSVRFPGFSTGIVHLNASGDVSSSGIAVADFATATPNRLYGTNGSGAGALITVPAAGLTLSGGALAFANDLAGLEGLSGTGIARRTGTDAWSVGTTVSVAEGGTGTTTLTGMLNGNGTGAVTAITDAGTVGRVLRVTGANAFAFGALDLANANAVTGDLPLSNVAPIAARSLLGNTSGSTGDIGAFTIGSLTQKVTPAGTDLVLIQDQAASGALKYATVTAVAAAAGAGDFVGPGSATDNAVLRFDGTSGKLGQNSGVLIDDSSNIVPATNDVGALGTTSLKWADAFFASGAVLNFNSGDVTVTHASNALAFAGASSGYAFDAMLDLSGAAAGQIRFPATQNASANANTLDDYEEGTWTPTGNGMNFASASGSYTKIGNRVLINCFVNWPSTTNGNEALINSVPFIVASNCAIAVGFIQTAAVISADSGTTRFNIRSPTGGTITNANLSTQFLVCGGQFDV